MSKKVSVIIPNYNHRQFLEQRIQTVLEQSYQNLEVIILDDASNDGSVQIISKYKDHPKVAQVLINNSNSGSVFKQWIKGIEASTGDYIWIAESDDFASTDFLKETVDVLNANENQGMVFTDSIKVNAQNEQQGLVSESKVKLKNRPASPLIINKENCVYYLLESLIVVNASSVLFKKSILDRFIDKTKLAKFQNLGDVFTYLSIALHSDIYFLAKPLNFMRLHETNTTKANKKSGTLYKDQIYLLNEMLDNFVDHKQSASALFNYYIGLFFFSLDFGYKKELIALTHRLVSLSFIDNAMFNKVNKIIKLYSFTTLHGKPHFLRERYKKMLKRTLHGPAFK